MSCQHEPFLLWYIDSKTSAGETKGSILDLKLYYTHLAASQFNYLPRFQVVKRDIKLPVKVDNKLTSKKVYCQITKDSCHLTWHQNKSALFCLIFRIKRLEVRYATGFFFFHNIFHLFSMNRRIANFSKLSTDTHVCLLLKFQTRKLQSVTFSTTPSSGTVCWENSEPCWYGRRP